MKNSTWIGKKGYRYWYYRFRDSDYYSLVLTGVVIFVSIMLIFYVIIPEITNWFSIREEVLATQQKIATIQQNIVFINNINKAELTTQLNTTAYALQPEKDFGAILQSISHAAVSSGVALNNFSFQIGDVTGSKKKSRIETNGLSAIQLTIIVNGSTSSIVTFLKTLENSLPLSQITSIEGGGNDVTVQLSFYQKPFPTINFSEDTQLKPLSSRNVTLLQTLSKWYASSGIMNSSNTVVSSGSAMPLF